MKIQITLIMICLALPLISADQVIWNDDSDIIIQDIWEDIDGTPLTGATCNWTVYNSDGSVNQSGTHAEIAPGVFNLTVSQLPIGSYPFLFNCTKNFYNGSSTIREIKIVDELTEEFKDSIDQINVTVLEVNETTHMTYDLLTGEINDTLNLILTTSNISANITLINERLDSILEDTDLLVEKWGTEDADDIIDLIKDLRNQIRDLDFRIDFVSSGELESRMLSITSTAKSTWNKLNDSDGGTNWWLWFWIGLACFIILLIILIIASTRKHG